MTQRTTRRRFLRTTALAGAGFAGARVLGAPAATVESAPPAGAATPWYRRTLRWMQTNIAEIDVTRYDIPWWREQWKQTGTQGIVVNAGGDVQIIIDAPTGSSVKAGGTATVQNVGTGVVQVNGEDRPNTQFASVTNNRIIPPDNALPRTSVVPAVPVSEGGGKEIQLPAEAAGDALDQGFPVEVDLTPGPKLRRR